MHFVAFLLLFMIHGNHTHTLTYSPEMQFILIWNGAKTKFCTHRARIILVLWTTEKCVNQSTHCTNRGIGPRWTAEQPPATDLYPLLLLLLLVFLSSTFSSSSSPPLITTTKNTGHHFCCVRQVAAPRLRKIAITQCVLVLLIAMHLKGVHYLTDHTTRVRLFREYRHFIEILGIIIRGVKLRIYGYISDFDTFLHTLLTRNGH